MRVVISIVKHELPMAHQWFDWVCELGGTEGHQLHLIPASGVDIKDIFEKANRAFHGQVSIQIDYEAETSDWQKPDNLRSASGPNSSFRQVAWDVYMAKKGPFFWCELDCVPLKKDWLNRLESEYQVSLANGKPFMGAQVQIERVPEHMSGCAVYPSNIPEEAPKLVMRTTYTCDGQPQPMELAFDVAGAPDVLPKAYWTNLIQHKFRYEGFKSREQFDSVIDPNAVVFHSCKDGSIYKYLRENLSGGVTSRLLPVHGKDDSLPAQDGAGETVILPVEPAPSLPCVERPIESNPHPPTSYVSTHGTGEGVVPLHDNRPVDAGFTVTNKPTVTNRTFGSHELHEAMAKVYDMPSPLSQMSAPWANKKDSEEEVRLLCAALATFCKAPVYKSRVRQALREAKIIK